MIRFVDLTEAYWGGDGENVRENPCCAFLDTVDDQFVREDTGGQVFFDEEDIDHIVPNKRDWSDGTLYDLTDLRERCKSLVPEGFWK